MRIYFFFISCLATFFYSSCGTSSYKPKNEFIQMIGGNEVNLKRKLGSEFSLIEGRSTKTYFISYKKEQNTNTIILDGDTVFSGKITKFKGLYLLHKALPSGNWQIHAINITDSTITGLGSELEQSYLIDKKIEEGKLSSAIVDSSDIVTLKPDNKVADILFYTILRKIDTRKRAGYQAPASDKHKTNTESDDEKEAISGNDFLYIDQFYPVKVRKKLTIKLKRNMPACNYQIENDEGDIVMEGKLSRRREVIDCLNLRPGKYSFIIEENEESFIFSKR